MSLAVASIRSLLADERSVNIRLHVVSVGLDCSVDAALAVSYAKEVDCRFDNFIGGDLGLAFSSKSLGLQVKVRE